MKTETDISKEQEMANSWREEIYANLEQGTPFGTNEDGEELTGFDWLEDVLEIQYVVSAERKYHYAKLLLSWGGPNVWLDTSNGKLEVFWGSDKGETYLPEGFTDYLNYTLEECWEMGA